MTGRLAVKGGKYYVVISYKDENGKYKNKWIATGLDERNNKRAATDMMREIVAQFEQGILPTVQKKADRTRESLSNNELREEENINSPLFSDYLWDWLEMAKPNLQITTYAVYKRRVKSIAEYFKEKHIRLCNLKPRDIQDFYSFLQKNGKSIQECHHCHTIIHRALHIAYRADYIKTNPADKIERPKSPKYKAKFYTIEQMSELFKKLQGDPYEFIYKLTAIYGLRRSEVCGLRWESVDFERDTITLEHAVVQCEVNGKRTIVKKDKMKNQSSMRTLPLLPMVKEILLKVKSEQERNIERYGSYYSREYLGYVCVDDVGKIVRPDTLTTHFRTFLLRNNLPLIRLHELRHSCASILIACGVSMKAVQEWLGHSTFSTTADIYSHLNYSSKLAVADTLTNVFNGKPVPKIQSDTNSMDTMQKLFSFSEVENPDDSKEKRFPTVYESWDETVEGKPEETPSISLKDEPIEKVFPELPSENVSEFRKAKEEMKRLGFETLDEYFEYLEFKSRMEQRNNTAGSGGTSM